MSCVYRDALAPYFVYPDSKTVSVPEPVKPVEPVYVSISFPDGIWQALKDEFFPSWLRKRYPVRMKTYTYEVKHSTYFIFRKQL
jgi:hypothetical protein